MPRRTLARAGCGRLLRENGLGLAMAALFAVSLVGHSLTGHLRQPAALVLHLDHCPASLHAAADHDTAPVTRELHRVLEEIGDGRNQSQLVAEDLGSFIALEGSW